MGAKELGVRERVKQMRPNTPPMPKEPYTTLLESIRSLGAAAEVVALLQEKFASGELMTKAAHEAAVEKAVRDADQNRTWEEDVLDP